MDKNIFQPWLKSTFYRSPGQWWSFAPETMRLLRQMNKLRVYSLQHAFSLRDLQDARSEADYLNVVGYRLEQMAREVRRLGLVNVSCSTRENLDVKAIVFEVRGYEIMGPVTLAEFGIDVDIMPPSTTDFDNVGVSPLVGAYATFRALEEYRRAYNAARANPTFHHIQQVREAAGLVPPSHPNCPCEPPDMLEVTNMASPPGVREYIHGPPPRPDDPTPQPEVELTTDSLKDLLGPPTHKAGKVKFNSEGGFSAN